MRRLLVVRQVLILAAAVCLALTLGPIAGRALESRVFPVARDFSLEISQREAEALVFSLYGEKVRDCDLQSLRAFVLIDGYWQPAHLTVQGVPMLLQARPMGLQVWQDWRVEPTGTRLQLVVQHRCHWGWLSTTKLGDWPTGNGSKP